MKDVFATSENNCSGYICFADFEFTCGGFISSDKSEMLSAGAVICSHDYEIAERFYSTAKPNRFPKMTRQCRELTKLSQDEINASPDSNDVLGELLALMRKYGVNKLFVWGNFDKPGLSADLIQHKRVGRPGANVKKICSMICDIQDETTAKMDLPQAVSISELSAALGYMPRTGCFHNALNDAEALYTIHKAAYTTDLTANRRFCQLKQERLDKLTSIRLELEKQRREEALSLPQSPAEEVYCSTADKDEMQAYIGLRIVFVKALRRYPDEEKLVLLEFRDTGKRKVVPEQKFRFGMKGMSTWYIPFRRSEWRSVLLEVCKKAV